MTFDLGKWFGMSFTATYNVKALYEYASDQDGYKAYFESRKLIVGGLDGKVIERKMTKYEIEQWSESRYEDSRSALNSMLRMQVVYQSSLIDGLLEHFLNVLFFNRPERMKAVEKWEKRLQIAFDDIFAFETKDKIVSNLAERAAELTIEGNIKSVLKRVSEITGEIICRDIYEPVMQIVQMRNAIIHEGARPEVSMDEVEKCHNDIAAFMCELAKYCRSEGIGVYDPAYLLNT